MVSREDFSNLFKAEVESGVPINEILQHIDSLAAEQKAEAKDLFSIGATGVAGSDVFFKCRGMVQEIHPDISLFAATPSNFFSRTLSDDDNHIFIDVSLVYVVPVPNNMYLYSNTPDCATTAAAALKRSREQMEAAHTPDRAEMNLPQNPVHSDLNRGAVISLFHSHSRGASIKLNQIIDCYGFAEVATGGPYGVSVQEELETLDGWKMLKYSSASLTPFTCLHWAPYSPPLDGLLPAKDFASVRQWAIDILSTHLTGGDALLSEFLLLHLCSHVVEHNSTTPIGDVPLLVCSETASAKEWSAALSKFVPVSELYIDQDVIRANLTTLVPRYNVEENYLCAGLFQVGDGTHVTVDCDPLQVDRGDCTDIFFNLVHKQCLMVQYPYQFLSIPVHLGFLGITKNPERTDPLFRFAFCVPSSVSLTSPTAPSFEEALRLRCYVESVRNRSVSFTANSDIQCYLTECLTQFSQRESGWNNRDSIVHNNTLSVTTSAIRTHCLTLGCGSIEKSHIDYVLSLERARMARLRL